MGQAADQAAIAANGDDSRIIQTVEVEQRRHVDRDRGSLRLEEAAGRVEEPTTEVASVRLADQPAVQRLDRLSDQDRIEGSSIQVHKNLLSAGFSRPARRRWLFMRAPSSCGGLG